jgi:LacI family transcriptional regulator
MKKIPTVVLLIETSTGRGRGLLRGIAKYSHLYGPWAFYWENPFYREFSRKGKLLSWIKELSADGIIARDMKNIDIEKLIALNIPTVSAFYGKEYTLPMPTFASDYLMAGKMAAEYFLELGLKKFAFCGFDDMYWSQERAEGFGKRIEQAGFEVNFYKQPKSKTKRIWENEQPHLAEWLRKLPKPIGLMTCNDDRSQYVIEACKVAQVHVPEEVAILGVDNDELLCELSEPPLSSIVHNSEKTGYEVAALLHKMMAGEKIENNILIDKPTHIVARQSTNILAIEDREVANAIRFIRQHSKELIQVNDVAEAVALSRRALEQRFCRILGRSVLKEIKRIRIDEITRLLVETNLSVSEIASKLGYSSVNNISRYFRQEKGISLQEYRKKCYNS